VRDPANRRARVGRRGSLLLVLLLPALLSLVAPGHARAADLDLSACAAQPTSTDTGDLSSARKYSATSAHTYDLTGATITQRAGKRLYAATVAGAAGACVLGPGSTTRIGVQSANTPSAKWWSLKQCCDGAGLVLTAGETSVWAARMDNVALDGIRANNEHGPVHVHQADLTNIRDDCITTSHDNVTIDDSYLECHTGISWRNVGGNGRSGDPFNLSLTNTLIYIKPMAGNGSGGSCTTWVVNGLANGPVWKMDTTSSGGRKPFHGDVSRFTVRNVIVRMDLDNHEAPCKPGNVGREWPAATYDNVTFVWTAARPYPGTLPAGVRMTTDVSAFENAKTDWLICHGYQQGVVIPNTGFDTCQGAPPPIDPPGVSTDQASDVTDTTATLHGTVNPRGSDTTSHFEYGTDDTYGQSTDVMDVGSGTDGVADPGPLSGLVPSTTYHYRIDATNAGGTALGLDQTFTTADPPPPP
jgi:hypothetical protein